MIYDCTGRRIRVYCKCDRNIYKKSGRPADLSAACGLAALVKCFDRVNNLSNMALGFTRDRMAEYVEETERDIVPLLRMIKDEAPEYDDACWLLSYQMYSLLETFKRLL